MVGHRFDWWVLVALVVLLGACSGDGEGQAQAQVEASGDVVLGATVSPTAEPTAGPSPTPVPTATPLPTATPSPTPDGFVDEAVAVTVEHWDLYEEVLGDPRRADEAAAADALALPGSLAVGVVEKNRVALMDGGYYLVFEDDWDRQVIDAYRVDLEQTGYRLGRVEDSEEVAVVFLCVRRSGLWRDLVTDAIRFENAKPFGDYLVRYDVRRDVESGEVAVYAWTFNKTPEPAVPCLMPGSPRPPDPITDPFLLEVRSIATSFLLQIREMMDDPAGFDPSLAQSLLVPDSHAWTGFIGHRQDLVDRNRRDPVALDRPFEVIGGERVDDDSAYVYLCSFHAGESQDIDTGEIFQIAPPGNELLLFEVRRDQDTGIAGVSNYSDPHPVLVGGRVPCTITNPEN